MEAIAKLNNCPVSPRKMRLVANQIRGKKVDKALNLLKFNQKPTYAEKLEKLLLSAIANWQVKNGEGADISELAIKEIRVDGGRVLKRLRPAPQGRAFRIRKRSNHVTIVVDSIAASTSAETLVNDNQDNDE